MKTRSLTQTLIVGVLLAEMLCAICFSVAAITYEMNGRKHAFDIMLRGRADSVLGAIHDAEDPDDTVMVDQTELVLPEEDMYEVTMDSGRMAGHSSLLPATLHNILTSPREDGYFNFHLGGRGYRALRMPGMRVIDREENGGLRRPVTIVYAAPTVHLWHETLEAVRFYVVASVILLLLTGLVIAWFLGRAMAPLRELALRAESVSTASWDFDAPEEALRTRELEPIASSIQNLVVGLRKSFERQKQFTGDAAHELKTSIALLKSSLQLITMRERTKQEYECSIEGLLMDTQRMEDLTNRMLVLARVEEVHSLTLHGSDLSTVLSLVVERLRPAMRMRQVEINLPEQRPTQAIIEPEDTDLLLSNLLMNAVQYSAPGTTITVALKDVGGSVEVLISDEGEGIAPTAMPHIFERFYRADSSRSRSNGGAGLGLAICKAIADRSGGSISISSTVGLGTTVKVVLIAAT